MSYRANIANEALLDRACEISSLERVRQIVNDALGDFVQRCEIEQKRKELYDHIDQGIADAEAGRVLTMEELDTHMKSILNNYA
jgi:predicted transcriptional regulator